MHPLQPGDPKVLGRYALIARLGSGGMGHVFLGRTRGGRTVAVKAVRAELAGDPEFRRRFRREVAAARAVSGRFTAAVVDADPDAAVPWLATAYVSGLSLREVVADGWVLPDPSVAVLAGGLARALAEIHAAGVVHRDLKPSNVMLAVDGPRVIDFGISRVLADSSDMTQVGTGTIVGSPGFMSPEQARGLDLTGATDVFSLGTVLAYAATGHNPFGDGVDQTLLYRIVHGEPDLSQVPADLLPLVTACLAKDPADRPTPQEVMERAARPPEGPWLPAALTASIAQSAAEILDYEGIAQFPEGDGDGGAWSEVGSGAAGAAMAAAGASAAPGTDQQPSAGTASAAGDGSAAVQPTMVIPPTAHDTRVLPASPETRVLPAGSGPPSGFPQQQYGGSDGGYPGVPIERTALVNPPEPDRRRNGVALFLLSVAVIAALVGMALALLVTLREKSPSAPATPAVSVTTVLNTVPTTAAPPSPTTAAPTTTPTPTGTTSSTPTPSPTSSTPTPTPTSDTSASTTPSTAASTPGSAGSSSSHGAGATSAAVTASGSAP